MRNCNACGTVALRPMEAEILYKVKILTGSYTTEVAKRARVSVSSASNRLSKLEAFGLLKREFHPQPSGGYESFWKRTPGAKWCLEN